MYNVFSNKFCFYKERLHFLVVQDQETVLGGYQLLEAREMKFELQCGKKYVLVKYFST